MFRRIALLKSLRVSPSNHVARQINDPCIREVSSATKERRKAIERPVSHHFVDNAMKATICSSLARPLDARTRSQTEYFVEVSSRILRAS